MCSLGELCPLVLGVEAFHFSSDGMKTYQDVQKVVSRKVFSCQKKPAGGFFLVSDAEVAGCSFLVEGSGEDQTLVLKLKELCPHFLKVISLLLILD